MTMPDTMIPTAAAPSVSTTIPVEIAQAIGAVMTQIKSLPKGERNAHGGYDFASIDDFLAAVGPLCSAAGLLVFQDEDTLDLIDRGGKAWLRITYAFTLGHVSGVMCDRPTRRTVFQAVTGPQTTGSSQSYAFKMFMRSLFMVPTGDRDDADFIKPQDMPAAEKAAQKLPQRVEQPRSTQHTQKPSERAQRAPSDSDKPQHMPFPVDASNEQARAWAADAKDAMQGRSETWRRAWLDVNSDGVDELREISAQAAKWVHDIATAADQPDAGAA
jgi:hypothetical protein